MNIIKIFITTIFLAVSFLVSLTIINAEDMPLTVIPPESSSHNFDVEDVSTNSDLNYKELFKDNLIIGDSIIDGAEDYDIIDSANIISLSNDDNSKMLKNLTNNISNLKPKNIYIISNGKDISLDSIFLIISTIKQASSSSSVYIFTAPNPTENEELKTYNTQIKEKSKEVGYKCLRITNPSSEKFTKDGKHLSKKGFELIIRNVCK